MPKPNSPQFDIVYHSSDYEEPPHLSGKGADSAFFAGTRESALDRAIIGREFMHSYRVPKSAMSEELYGDDHMEVAQSVKPERIETMLYADGDQPSLWQTTPVSISDAVKRSKVLRYKNAYEDAGSTSFVIPQGDSMQKLGVEYLGMERLGRKTYDRSSDKGLDVDPKAGKDEDGLPL